MNIKKTISVICSVVLVVSVTSPHVGQSERLSSHISFFNDQALSAPSLSHLNLRAFRNPLIASGFLSLGLIVGVEKLTAERSFSTDNQSGPVRLDPSAGSPASPRFKSMVIQHLISLLSKLTQKYGPDHETTRAVKNFLEVAQRNLLEHPEQASLIWDMNARVIAVGLDPVAFQAALTFRFPTLPSSAIIADLMAIKEGASITHSREIPDFYRDLIRRDKKFRDAFEGERLTYDKNSSVDDLDETSPAYLANLANDLVDAELYGYLKARDYLYQTLPLALVLETLEKQRDTPIGNTLDRYTSRLSKRGADLRASIFLGEVRHVHPEIERAVRSLLGVPEEAEWNGKALKRLKEFLTRQPTTEKASRILAASFFAWPGLFGFFLAILFTKTMLRAFAEASHIEQIDPRAASVLGSPASPEVKARFIADLDMLLESLREKYGPSHLFTRSIVALRQSAKRELVIHPHDGISQAIASLIWADRPPIPLRGPYYVAGVGINDKTFAELTQFRGSDRRLANAVLIKEGSTIVHASEHPETYTQAFDQVILFRSGRYQNVSRQDMRRTVNQLIDAEAQGYDIAGQYLEQEGIPHEAMTAMSLAEKDGAAQRMLAFYPARLNRQNLEYRVDIFLNEFLNTYHELANGLAVAYGLKSDPNTGLFEFRDARTFPLRAFVDPSIPDVEPLLADSAPAAPAHTKDFHPTGYQYVFGDALTIIALTGLRWITRRKDRIRLERATVSVSQPTSSVLPQDVVTAIQPGFHFYRALRVIASSRPPVMKHILRVLHAYGRPVGERLLLRFGATSSGEEIALSSLGLVAAQTREDARASFRKALESHLSKLVVADLEDATLEDDALQLHLVKPFNYYGESYSDIEFKLQLPLSHLSKALRVFESFARASQREKAKVLDAVRSTMKNPGLLQLIIPDSIVIPYRLPDEKSRNAFLDNLGIAAGARSDWERWILTEQDYVSLKTRSFPAAGQSVIPDFSKVKADRLIPAPPAPSQSQRGSRVHVQFNFDIGNCSIAPAELLQKLLLTGSIRYKTDQMSAWSDSLGQREIPLEDIRVLGTTPHGYYVIGGSFKMPEEANDIEFSVHLYLDGYETWVETYTHGDAKVYRAKGERETTDFSPDNLEIRWAGDTLFAPKTEVIDGKVYQRMRVSVELKRGNYPIEDVLHSEGAALRLEAKDSAGNLFALEQLRVMGQDQRHNYIVEGLLPVSSKKGPTFNELIATTRFGSSKSAFLSPLQQVELGFMQSLHDLVVSVTVVLFAILIGLPSPLDNRDGVQGRFLLQAA